MYQSEYSLILYPLDATVFVSQQQLIDQLGDLELLGKQESQERYQVGEGFLSLFCFVGCSPNIELFPQNNNQPYCYIEIPESFAVTRCIISENVKIPRCPHCKTDLVQLPRQLKENCCLALKCHACSKSINPFAINWRKSAVFAKSYIVIGNIYEAEAIPDTKLLDTLEQATQVSWQYAYIRF